MATETGTIQIERIEPDDGGTVFVRGVFTSVNERNVYNATPDVGVTILLEARESLGLPFLTKADLKAGINHVTFATPNKAKTVFAIALTKREIADGLQPTEWDSYRLG